VPGVQCEHCHGDTAAHLEGLRKGDPKLFVMRDLKKMTADESAHFCGQCHRIWEQIAENGPMAWQMSAFSPIA
jgi:nitrate reductase cytochrome c-type subunit